MPHQMGLPAPAQTSESTSDVEEAEVLAVLKSSARGRGWAARLMRGTAATARSAPVSRPPGPAEQSAGRGARDHPAIRNLILPWRLSQWQRQAANCHTA